MSKLVPARPEGILSALAQFGVKPSDTFKITNSKGVLAINKRSEGGLVHSMRMRAKGSFKQVSQFDQSQITVQERRELEAGMYRSGLSQSEIADLLGVSQATVSLDLKHLKKRAK